MSEKFYSIEWSNKKSVKINLLKCSKFFNCNKINKRSENSIEFSFTNFGKKGRDWCRKEKLQIDTEYLGVVGGSFGFSIAATAGKTLVDAFLEGTYDEVYLVYAEFVSMARQVPALQQLIPIPPIETGEVEETEEDGEQSRGQANRNRRK